MSVAELEGILKGIVAEKTGYPEEMLEMDMDLESGLGIDSIKRVEILADLQEQFPALKDVDAAELSELATLQAILDYARNLQGNNDAVKKKSVATV